MARSSERGSDGPTASRIRRPIGRRESSACSARRASRPRLWTPPAAVRGRGGGRRSRGWWSTRPAAGASPSWCRLSAASSFPSGIAFHLATVARPEAWVFRWSRRLDSSSRRSVGIVRLSAWSANEMFVVFPAVGGGELGGQGAAMLISVQGASVLVGGPSNLFLFSNLSKVVGVRAGGPG